MLRYLNDADGELEPGQEEQPESETPETGEDSLLSPIPEEETSQDVLDLNLSTAVESEDGDEQANILKQKIQGL